MEITRATDALRSAIDTVDAYVHDILHSGNYYCTEEIARELNLIRNGLEHLRLDGTLLASHEWQESFDPRKSAANIAGATSVLDQAAARLFDYKSQLCALTVGKKEENDVRAIHQWAMTTLQRINKEMAPYAYGATDRIKLFGDHVGVTDRFTGYRHNLTRSSQERVKMETSWMNKKQKTGFMNPASDSCTTAKTDELPQRPQFECREWGPYPADNIGSLVKEVRFSNNRPLFTINRGYRTIDSLYPRSNTFTVPGVRTGGDPNYSEHVNNIHFMNNMNDALTYQAEHQEGHNQPAERGFTSRSVQEQAGINTVFPGPTEYMRRYKNPVRMSRCRDLLINPKPNMYIFGRPLGNALYYQNLSEVQTSFKWPDGNKICKLPWTRK